MSDSRVETGVVPAEVFRTLAGIDLLRGMLDGTYPSAPITATLGFAITEVAPGRVVFAGVPRFEHYNPLGSVHGGWTATLLDSCMGCAVHSLLPAGRGYTTLEFKVTFIRPVLDATGTVRAEGTTLNVGRSAGTAEGRLVDARGRLLAHGTTTCMVFPL
ncbi:MAG: PaaI family thioesterase [Alphaproteobacteria bacterium]